MGIGRIGYILLLIAICLSGCNVNSDIKDSLSYDEYISEAKKFASQDNNEKAISAYQKALKIKVDDANTHYILGRLYDKEEQLSYKSAFNKYQSDILTNLNKKRNKDQTKELEGYGYKSSYKAHALQEYKNAIKYSPEHWAARYFVATDHFNNKRYNEAIEEYKQVIEFNPKGSNAFSLLGESYLVVGKCALALNNFAQAFKLNSDAESYYYDSGRVYVKLRNAEKATEMINHLKGSKYYYDLTGYQPNGKCSDVGVSP